MRKRLYIISYDISDNRRRRRIADLLQSTGLRKQKSVFECMLAKKTYRDLLEQLYHLIDPSEDSILVYHLSADDAAKRFYLGKDPGDFPSSYDI